MVLPADTTSAPLPPTIDEIARPDRAELVEAGRVVVERVAALVRDLPDTAIPIPGSEWTVGEAAAHLAFVNIGMAIMARGLEVPYVDESLGRREGLAEANAGALEGYSERDGGVLAGSMVNGGGVFLAEAMAQPDDRMCRTPMGAFPVDVLVSYFLAHHLVHGCAIARALSRPYPFDAAHVRLIWPFLRHALPLVVAPTAADGLGASIEVRVRGVLRFVVTFENGRLSVGASVTRPVDCTVEADPLAFFLMSAKLVDISELVARGELTVRGSRPELGLRFPTLFDIP